jgi:peroxiredoxin
MKTHSGWMASLMVGLLLGSSAALAAEKAPDFSLPDLNGKTFKLSEALGKKTVVINFWAAWCTTCKEEIPQLVEFQKQWKSDEAVFLGINAGDPAAKAKKFQDRNKYPYTVLLDEAKTTAKLYGVNGIPQTLVIDPKGEIVYRGSRPPKER